DGSGFGIMGRRFGANLQSPADEFVVNTSTSGDQRLPKVDRTDDGCFIVVWSSADSAGLGVYGQRFDPDGIRLGSEFRANTFTAGYQGAPSVAVDRDE